MQLTRGSLQIISSYFEMELKAPASKTNTSIQVSPYLWGLYLFVFRLQKKNK